MTNEPHSAATGGARLRSRADVTARLRELIAKRGLIPPERLEASVQRAAWLEEPLERLLVNDGLLQEETVLDLLSEVSGLGVAKLAHARIQPDAIEAVPARMVVHYGVMPLRLEEDALVLGCDRILEGTEEDRIRMLLGRPVHWTLCTRREISESVNHYYGVGIEAFLNLQPPESDSRSRRTAATPDISAFVREVILDAIRAGATDIHFEPFEHHLRLRYRIDGVLHDIPLPRGIEDYRRAVISSTKVMAQLNIAEHRLPQDGRFSLAEGEASYDIRVSVLPSRHGETVNLRILNRTATFFGLEQIAPREDQRRLIEELIDLSHGIVLFTGPTGSGKTTSLYAALARLNNPERKIITIEDPVEYQIEGITQLQAHHEIGFDFAAGLRSVLRHDPDVVLIGEIRDHETADIAINASLTGHLVLSTLHTNDAASAITRLLDIGIEPYLVASSLEGVVAQRLVRKVCRSCREAVPLDGALRDEARRLAPRQADGDLTVYRGRGCPDCRFTGYAGRGAIFEILLMTDRIRSLAAERAASTEIMRVASGAGLVTLRESGWTAVLEGETTVEDVLRVTQRPR